MIARIAVIGAGVMGAGIAAQAANAGVSVVLLDLIPGAAAKAVAAMVKTEPAPLMHPDHARRITPGDLETDLAKVADCDWIIEAIIERPDAKRALYARLDTLRKPGSVVSSNTSTIPLADLLQGLPDAFAGDFLITHFFNPPRYMKLLEVVTGPATRPEAKALVRDFADRALGKTVIDCNDRPGFIANRIGTMWLSAGVRHAIDLGLTIEEADAVAGAPMGVPRTGIFGLLDLVGIDLMPHVMGSLLATLPAEDDYRRVYRDEPLMRRMIAEGRIGRKGSGGFTRMQRDGKARIRLSTDLQTGEYRPEQKPALASLDGKPDLRRLAEHQDRGGVYARRLLLDTLSYAASLVPEIAATIADVDAGMRLGYNWQDGPFALIDRLGPSWLAAELRREGRPVPPLLDAVGEGSFYRVQNGRLQEFGTDGAYHDIVRAPGVLLLSDLRLTCAPLAANPSASLWDIGDDVACLEFHTKMNALDGEVMDMIRTAVARGTAGNFKALVLSNEGANFSVGANLKKLVAAAEAGQWDAVEHSVIDGQAAFRLLRQAPFPTVGAPAGMALGGGCEVLMHCSAVQAHAESYIGLVEVGVGLVPGWGGCVTLLRRWATDPRTPKGPMPAAISAFEIISTGLVSKSATDAQRLKLLPSDCGITMNRDRLLADAKSQALAMVDGYQPPAPVPLKLAGPAGRITLGMAVQAAEATGRATAHDATVCDGLAEILTGGAADPLDEVSEDQLYSLERAVLMRLVRTPQTKARIVHMLDTGKPLRN